MREETQRPRLLQSLPGSTEISEEDRRRLEALVDWLPLIADAVQADIFIDMPLDAETALVVAHGRPSVTRSLYRESPVGQTARMEQEPAVIEVHRTGRPAYGIEAVSQEGTRVRQDVVPLTGGDGRTIGSLIVERDMEKVLREAEARRAAEESQAHLQRVLAQVQSIGGRVAEVSAALASATADLSRAHDAFIGRYKQLEASSEDVQHRLRGVQELTQFVQKVANQTKILGLNAGLEAARAGSSGLGFRVIADEIRRLSEQVHESAGHIRDELHSLVGAVSQSIGDMSVVLEAAAGQDRRIREVAGMTDALVQSMESLRESLRME
ncbi:histidine kinase N-terminal domain-containing protein [Kyrpidia sp.]|uniref:histidine kinase N-terminal domain-containing protein n=1 Tax=Kyrpidia sp. TaxID=2073077 RepID=UPI0025855678|nr:histidine kinase N-terminal domain-containing protein [Kyrpidia sp.]MCL6575835.1 histidine kinase N-terminal domain-containing protein [Kyrpidia sp.]